MMLKRRAKAANPVRAAAATPSVSIQQLGDDLLCRVLLLIPQGQRLHAAMVCKAWNQLLRRPDMWTTVEYPRRQLSICGSPMNDISVGVDQLRWLTSRCHSAQSLRIEGQEENGNGPKRNIGSKMQMLLVAFAAAPALRDLHMQLPDHLIVGADTLVHAKLLSGLTKLHLHGVTPPVTTAALDSVFSALPSLQACSLGLRPRAVLANRSIAGLPTAVYSCTQLTSLEIFDAFDDPCLNWGGLSDGITALRKLARLRLQNVLSAPLTDAISALTNLTSIGLTYDKDDSESEALLPPAAAMLPRLRQLDVTGHMPPVLGALTGVQDLTLRFMDLRTTDLVKLSSMCHLSRLRFCSCGDDFLRGKILRGLDGCTELQQLHVSDCGLHQLTACRVLQQVTELRLQYNGVGMSILALVASVMPQLVTLDLSHNSIVPSELIEVLRGCANLRHIWLGSLGSSRDGDYPADDILEVQCAVPRVRWHLRPVPYDSFDETQQFCKPFTMGM